MQSRGSPPLLPGRFRCRCRCAHRGSHIAPASRPSLTTCCRIIDRSATESSGVSTPSSIRAFDLLWEIGRDCVGALQFLPVDASPADIRQITGQRLTTDGVAQLLAGSLDSTFAGEDGIEDAFRISLAGAQEKTALLFHEGVWHRPTHTTPTTHILKLPLGINCQGIDLSTSVENEWLCAQIARAYGIEVASCRMETFGEYKTLVVERFDRRLAPDRTWYLRLPQEDLCQATATPPALKYESDGGPGIGKMMSLLLGSERPAKDQRDFMFTQLVFWVLAAINGHAKNFSFFLLPGGAFRLTPRYDILSAYPILGHGRGRFAPEKIRMAMAVHGKAGIIAGMKSTPGTGSKRENGMGSGT